MRRVGEIGRGVKVGKLVRVRVRVRVVTRRLAHILCVVRCGRPQCASFFGEHFLQARHFGHQRVHRRLHREGGLEEGKGMDESGLGLLKSAGT